MSDLVKKDLGDKGPSRIGTYGDDIPLYQCFDCDRMFALEIVGSYANCLTTPSYCPYCGVMEDET